MCVCVCDWFILFGVKRETTLNAEEVTRKKTEDTTIEFLQTFIESKDRRFIKE